MVTRVKRNQESSSLRQEDAKAAQFGVAGFVPKGDGSVSKAGELSPTLLANSRMYVMTHRSQHMRCVNDRGKK